MKRTIAAMTLCGSLACGSAGAQTPTAAQPPAGRTPPTPAPSAGMAGPPTQAGGASRAYTADTIPGPLKEDEIKPMAMALPDDPLEPYLLTKENGPFMVMAQVFRGPEAEKMAVALCKELREDYHLPAYILRTKDFPMRSYIRGTPVQTPSETLKPAIKFPEKIRTLDEAAVLVGNEKTEQGTEYLLKQVKRIQPKCMQAMPKLYPWRAGSLARALRTTNPLVPAQWLYPRTPDRLVVQMNSGPRSIANCPGHYTIQVAQFAGHAGFAITKQGENEIGTLLEEHRSKSPLQTAHDDAERLAERLANSPEFKKLGQPVFVYHDRTASRVFVGAFNAVDDPNALAVHEELLKIAGQLNATPTKSRWFRPSSDSMVIPATMLTSVDDLKKTIH